MNYTYFVVMEKNKENDKLLAHVRKVANCYNLLDFFTPSGGFSVVSVNAMKTRKEALKLADFWNENALKNNNYYLSDKHTYSAVVF